MLYEYLIIILTCLVFNYQPWVALQDLTIPMKINKPNDLKGMKNCQWEPIMYKVKGLHILPSFICNRPQIIYIRIEIIQHCDVKLMNTMYTMRVGISNGYIFIYILVNGDWS